MKKIAQKILPLVAASLVLAGCDVINQPRMTIVTGTTVGLHISPGNGNTTPPQLTLAYKRAELAVVPTAAAGSTLGTTNDTDAYSTLAAFDFQSGFTTPTSLKDFISTGIASRNLIQNNAFVNSFTNSQ